MSLLTRHQNNVTRPCSTICSHFCQTDRSHKSCTENRYFLPRLVWNKTRLSSSVAKFKALLRVNHHSDSNESIWKSVECHYMDQNINASLETPVRCCWDGDAGQTGKHVHGNRYWTCRLKTLRRDFKFCLYI